MKREIYNSINFLIKELHKEWNRPGVTKASVFILKEEAPKVEKCIAAHIATVQKEMDTADMTFKESIHRSRECFVLLRMAKKIKKMEDKADKKSVDVGFSVDFDKEELKLFREVIKEK